MMNRNKSNLATLNNNNNNINNNNDKYNDNERGRSQRL